MIILIIVASAFQLEYGFESLHYLNNIQEKELLTMSHLMNYIISLIAGLLNVISDLLMARKYLDTATKFYSTKYHKKILYGFGIFGTVIFLISLITMSILLAKLSSE